MNSIDREQPESNHADLSGSAAIGKLREIIKKSPSCFFSTAAHVKGSPSTRPMSVQQVDEAGNLWFLSPADSHKNAEILRDPSVTLYFQGSAHSDFLVLQGTASISTDQAKIHELWEPIIKTWFTEGENDPRITVIQVSPTGGYYWDTKHGNFVAGIKMLIGAATGVTLDDSIQGKISV